MVKIRQGLDNVAVKISCDGAYLIGPISMKTCGDGFARGPPFGRERCVSEKMVNEEVSRE